MSIVETIMQYIGAALILGGSVFCVIGAIGVIRLPDFYSRCHAAGVTDSAGAAGVLFGLCFMSAPLIAFKLITILAFLWLSSSVATHALVQAAYARGVRVENPRVKDWTHGQETSAKKEGEA
ncbi:MAG: monovalent cation/H(+) antiporter subunit G [Myxococcota bacterium]